MVEFKSKALTWRFWELLSRFYILKNGFSGTISDFSERLNFSTSDGFFYKVVLPILLKNDILIETNELDKRGYLGKYAKIYIFNKDKLSEFFVKENPITRIIYKVWVEEGDIDINIKTK